MQGSDEQLIISRVEQNLGCLVPIHDALILTKMAKKEACIYQIGQNVIRQCADGRKTASCIVEPSRRLFCQNIRKQQATSYWLAFAYIFLHNPAAVDLDRLSVINWQLAARIIIVRDEARERA